MPAQRIAKILVLAAAVAGLGGAAYYLSRVLRPVSAARPSTFQLEGGEDDANASDPVDLISAVDLEVAAIDGASDLEVTEKDYDCAECPIQSGKLEVSAAPDERPRMMHNSYDDGAHCSFDETYYLALDASLIHAVTLESCWEAARSARPGAEASAGTAERWDETRTYFHEGRAIKSQRRSGAAREELDGTTWEDDVAPVGDMLPKRAKALQEFFDSDDDYSTFFEGRKPP